MLRSFSAFLAISSVALFLRCLHNRTTADAQILKVFIVDQKNVFESKSKRKWKTAQEKRIAPDGSGPWTKSAFTYWYGGTTEWDNATPEDVGNTNAPTPLTSEDSSLLNERRIFLNRISNVQNQSWNEQQFRTMLSHQRTLSKRWMLSNLLGGLWRDMQ